MSIQIKKSAYKIEYYIEWEGFKEGKWSKEIDVKNFIQKNYTLYAGEDSFLEEPTEATKKLWEQCMELYKKEKDAGRG